MILTLSTQITTDSVDEGDLLEGTIETHKENTQKNGDMIVGDSRYAKIDNYLHCYDVRDIKIEAHLPSLHETQKDTCSRDGQIRRHLSERSFAQSKQYGYKRVHWRRLWSMEIQDFLIIAKTLTDTR